MLNLLFERGAVNEAFCARFATSVDALRRSVAPYSLDFVAQRCGVPAFGIVHPSEWELDPDNLPSSEELIRWSLYQSLMDTDTLMDSRSGFIREEELPVIEPAPEDDGARLDVCPPDVQEELKH